MTVTFIMFPLPISYIITTSTVGQLLPKKKRAITYILQFYSFLDIVSSSN